MIEIILSCILVINIATSVFIAHKLNDDYTRLVRFLCMTPMLISTFMMWNILNGEYVAFVADIFMSLGMMVPYLIVASRFTDNPLLQPEVKKD